MATHSLHRWPGGRAILSWLRPLLLLSWSLSCLGAAPMDEYSVKAAYLYNFTQYVKWPEGAFAGPGSPLNVCVAGDNPFDSALMVMEGKKSLEGHPIRIHHYPRSGPYASCHLLFVDRSLQHRFLPLLAQLQGLPVLTVSDIDGFTDRNGMIGLLSEGQHIVFTVNLAAARQAGLEVSSKLLRLARHVHNG